MAQGETWLGIAAAAAAAACFDGSVILQAREARAVAAVHALRVSLLRRLVARPMWLAGTAIAGLGWPLQLVAFSLAPITVVQPTLALGMLLLLGVGARVLHEHVGRREWAAAAAVIAGIAALAAVAPAHTQHIRSVAAVAIPMAILAVAVTLPFVVGGRRAGAWLLIVGAGCSFALTAFTNKLLTIELAHGRPWAAVGFLLLTIAAGAPGFLIDQSALQRFDATRTSPPMFVLETAIPVALAPVMFGERWSSTPGGGAVVVAGLALVLGGGAVLGASRTVTRIEHADAEPGDGLGQGDHAVGGGGPGAVGEVGPPR